MKILTTEIIISIYDKTILKLTEEEKEMLLKTPIPKWTNRKQYTWKYKGNKYYFDNYNCKQAFEMNPENIY